MTPLNEQEPRAGFELTPQAPRPILTARFKWTRSSRKRGMRLRTGDRHAQGASYSGFDKSTLQSLHD
jgi:hypothetical protein